VWVCWWRKDKAKDPASGSIDNLPPGGWVKRRTIAFPGPQWPDRL
jgi:hypothetical protein